MSETSPRLKLPLLAAGQAQKEITHNEALARLDICVQAVVEEELATPPVAPEIGQCWLVKAAAQGDWAGQEDAIACWTGGGWRYFAPFEGLTIWMRASGQRLTRESAGWTTSLQATSLRIDGTQVVGPQQAAISLPSGGGVEDVEARASIASIIASLAAHGLISN